MYYFGEGVRYKIVRRGFYKIEGMGDNVRYGYCFGIL